MQDAAALGVIVGAGAMMLKAVLLRPVRRSRASLWSSLMASWTALSPESQATRRLGWLFLACWGALFGLVFGLLSTGRPPVAGSIILSGSLYGLAVFLAAALALLVAGRTWLKGIDARLWIGYAITDVFWGANLGLAFLLWDTIGPGLA